MIGTGVVTAFSGLAVVLLALSVTGAGRILLVAAGGCAVALAAVPVVVASRRYGPERRLPDGLRDTNRGPPAVYTVVLEDGRRFVAAVSRGGYALGDIHGPPFDAREVVAVEPPPEKPRRS
jgi:hypothetical protein